jgi:hypothetical protein
VALQEIFIAMEDVNRLRHSAIGAVKKGKRIHRRPETGQ